MNSEFKKIKSSLRKEAVLKTATGALAFGLLALGVVVFLFRLYEIEISPLVYVGVGLGATAFGGGVLWLLLRRSEKSLARKLDKKYDLAESVQTMVEYQSVDGEILKMQRAQAEQKLSKVPKKFDWKKYVYYLVAFALALAIFIVAIFVPLNKETEPSDDGMVTTVQPFELTDYHRLAMANLIETVKTSEAEETEREQVVTCLETLLTDLESVTLQEEMKKKVKASMLLIDGVADVLNTCDDIYKFLIISDVESVTAFAKVIGTTDVQLLNENITSFKLKFENENASTLQTKIEFTEMALDEFVGTAKASLTFATSVVKQEDKLWLATNAFVSCFESVAEMTGDESDVYYEDLKNAVGLASTESKGSLELALAQQHKNRLLTDEVIDGLKGIFELADADMPDLNNDFLISGDDGQGEGGEENGNDGGHSSNTKEYGSDDEIFDPDTGTYRPYGDLITEYQGYINDIESELPDELRTYFNKYFERLRDSQDNE